MTAIKPARILRWCTYSCIAVLVIIAILPVMHSVSQRFYDLLDNWLFLAALGVFVVGWLMLEYTSRKNKKR